MQAETTTTATTATEGERRKLAAHGAIESRREPFILAGRRALLLTLLKRGQATADAIRDAVDLPAGLDPKLFGAVPGPLAAAGIIAGIGYRKSSRPEAHSRPVKVWGLKNRAAAVAWLGEHSEPVKPIEQRDDGLLFPLLGCKGGRRP